MTNIVISIMLGVAVVGSWYLINVTLFWLSAKIESYRYAKIWNKNLTFIKHILRRHKL